MNGSLNVYLIINLQREGEHPYCLPNNQQLDLQSGFAYKPQIFQSEEINCKLSGWKDMTSPSSINFIIEIIKEMAVAIKKKGEKVLYLNIPRF